MISVELEKCFCNNMLPLYLDIEDKHLKRVIAKLDSGPGRMNADMLAHLRIQGLYAMPGLPNSTGKTQETDQSYGPFKGGKFIARLGLWQVRTAPISYPLPPASSI